VHIDTLICRTDLRFSFAEQPNISRETQEKIVRLQGISSIHDICREFMISILVILSMFSNLDGHKYPTCSVRGYCSYVASDDGDDH
jgi:hypothetical protein